MGCSAARGCLYAGLEKVCRKAGEVRFEVSSALVIVCSGPPVLHQLKQLLSQLVLSLISVGALYVHGRQKILHLQRATCYSHSRNVFLSLFTQSFSLNEPASSHCCVYPCTGMARRVRRSSPPSYPTWFSVGPRDWTSSLQCWQTVYQAPQPPPSKLPSSWCRGSHAYLHILLR